MVGITIGTNEDQKDFATEVAIGEATTELLLRTLVKKEYMYAGQLPDDALVGLFPIKILSSHSSVETY